ncbi:HNH endonuclease [Algoriphagus terrigena]|uniref:HNH endonuclease n=1 Tax=Algoriphagus terrigena TaxID=344884 RepID=UPI00040BE7BB|nr:HNH endonuclease [Algoriphagus terrigena]
MVNQEQRACLAWDALLVAVNERRIYTYTELGRLIGVYHRKLGPVLGLIQEYCNSENLPPLTILVRNYKGGVGAGFYYYGVDSIEEGEKKVYGWNWLLHENPFEFARGGESSHSLVEKLLEYPENSSEVYVKVKSRGIAQLVFRRAVMKAYAGKCAFCKISWPGLLQASHIKPWVACSSKERIDVRNGILLCANHHLLYDTGILSVNNEYKISYLDPDEEMKPYSKMDRALTSSLHEKKMNLPEDKYHWPMVEYLDYR